MLSVGDSRLLPTSSQLSPRSSQHIRSSRNTFTSSQMTSSSTQSFDKDSLEVDGYGSEDRCRGRSPDAYASRDCQSRPAGEEQMTTTRHDGDIRNQDVTCGVEIKPNVNCYVQSTKTNHHSPFETVSPCMELSQEEVDTSLDNDEFHNACALSEAEVARELLLGSACEWPEPFMSPRSCTPVRTEIADTVACHLQSTSPLLTCLDEQVSMGKQIVTSDENGYNDGHEAADDDEDECDVISEHDKELQLPQQPSLHVLLGPLDEMSKADLVRVCENLEASLANKDREMETVNRQYEQLLEQYHDTAELLAQRNNELFSCKLHLQDASTSLQHWKKELLESQDNGSHSPVKHNPVHKMTETREALAAAASICEDTLVTHEAECGGKMSSSKDDVTRSTDASLDKTNGLKNPKRVARRLAQSQDNMARVVPILHRRRDAQTEAGKPTPKPRSSIMLIEDDEPAGHRWKTSSVQSSFAEVFEDSMPLHCTTPARMSYQTDESSIDILRIDDDRPNSSASFLSDETLPSDRRPPTVIEAEIKNSAADEDDTEDGVCCEVDLAASRPRTSCGRPLTGEKRPALVEDERPPTRSGPVCISKLNGGKSSASLDPSSGHSQDAQNDFVESALNSNDGEMDNHNVSNADGNCNHNVRDLDFKRPTPCSRTLVKLKDHDGAVISRPLTPHMKGSSYDGMRDDAKSADDEDGNILPQTTPGPHQLDELLNEICHKY